MKSKQQAIELAYGGKYDWDENGWVFYGVDESSEFGYEPFGEYEKRNEKDGVFEWRPLSLKGIETNNGWIKIESEKDLPTDKTTQYSVSKDKKVFQCTINCGTVRHWYNIGKITHYQPITKPEPPIH